MDTLSLSEILWFGMFIVLSAVFSGSETAFTAISPIKLRSLVDQRIKGADMLAKLLKNPRHLITAILIGNNVVNIGASAMATAVVMGLMESLGVTNLALALTVTTGIMTIILLIFGEITPKTIAIKNPTRIALFMAPIFYYFLLIIFPIVGFFAGISRLISNMLRLSSADVDKILTTDEIKSILALGAEEGVLEKEEKEMLHGIFTFSQTIVREIMTPRTDTVCLDVDSSVAEAVAIFMGKGHSRIPVYEEKIDNIIGILYAKDLLTAKQDHSNGSIRPFLRDAFFIPETQVLEDLLAEMKRRKFHMAIVVDEHGGMSGIVTLEDIIEEIVGEIQDEYDVEELPEVKELGPNHYMVEAKVNIQDLGDSIHYKFPEEDDYDTLGGFVLSVLGRLPKKNEEIYYKDLKITVREITKRRIRKLELEILDHPVRDEAD